MSLIFANSVNTDLRQGHDTCIDNSTDLRQGHDLPTLVNDSVFARIFFHETLHMRSFAKIKPSQTFPNLQYICKVIGLTFIIIPTLCLPEVKALRYMISLLPYVIRTKLSWAGSNVSKHLIAPTFQFQSICKMFH